MPSDPHKGFEFDVELLSGMLSGGESYQAMLRAELKRLHYRWPRGRLEDYLAAQTIVEWVEPLRHDPAYHNIYCDAEMLAGSYFAVLPNLEALVGVTGASCFSIFVTIEKMAKKKYPIKHWSYSSLISYLRNPLAWHKRYVEGVYDVPATPASIVGRAGHKALEHFYSGLSKEAAIDLGREYLRNISDFEINFGKATSPEAQQKKREAIEAEYLRAIAYYLQKPPQHDVLGVEVKALAHIPDIPIPVKAISDLVVTSSADADAIDIIDHKFVNAFGVRDIDNPLFMLQALFNYYTVLSEFEKPVRRFVVYECKKKKNRDGGTQLREHIIDFREHEKEFAFFHSLLADATRDLAGRTMFLPNPTDMFEGKNSLEIYRLKLVDDEEND